MNSLYMYCVKNQGISMDSILFFYFFFKKSSSTFLLHYMTYFYNRHVSIDNFYLCFNTTTLYVFRYYFENTAPQWYKFQILIWRKIQESIDKILSRKANLRQLVVAGVSEICTLHDEKVQRRFLYLYLPKVVTVPKFFWKMIYDYKTRKGTVFIGLNTAFNTYIREKRLCQSSMCPGFPNREDYERALIYCCSKESFEAAYGRLDSHVYQKF